MSPESNIERVVMRRVYRIAVLRPIISGITAALLIAIVALYGIGREVWVAKVFENGPQGFVGKSQYFVYAFDHTRLIVQSLVLVTLAAVMYLARESARLIERVLVPARA